jgi:transposase
MKKGNSVTIIGAVSLDMNFIFHHVTYSTNIDTVENFYKKFHKKCDLDDKVIIMDNHRSHGSNTVLDLLADNGAIIEFLPTCSSYFNPIETVWSWVKGKWRNSLLQVQNLREDH